MERYIPTEQKFANRELSRTLNTLDIHVTQYRRMVSDAEHRTDFTRAFLEYSDSLLSKLERQSRPVSIRTIPAEITELPSGKFFKRNPTKTYNHIEREYFFPDTHEFFAYYSSNTENPAMPWFLHPSLRNYPDEIREALSEERDAQGEPIYPSYDPPQYDLPRQEDHADERGSNNTFITFRTVEENGFHLTPERAGIVIEELNRVVFEETGNLTSSPQSTAFREQEQRVQDLLERVKGQKGTDMLYAFDRVLGALTYAEKMGIRKLPKELVFSYLLPNNRYKVDFQNKTLSKLIPHTVETRNIFKAKTAYTESTIDPVEVPDVMPALLKYFRNAHNLH